MWQSSWTHMVDLRHTFTFKNTRQRLMPGKSLPFLAKLILKDWNKY